MSDSVTPEKRSWIMSRIKGRETSIEIITRLYLYHHGFRYRKNVRSLPGNPDIVLHKYRTVIFVNGCFWHRHLGCSISKIPKTRSDYWEKKLNTNAVNDAKWIKLLRERGWKVLTVWECELKKDKDIRLELLCNEIRE